MIALKRGGTELVLSGFKTGIKVMISIIPILLIAFLIIGLIQAVLPKEAIEKIIGRQSGFRGLLVASIMGSLTPGGPYTSFPIMVALLKAGADFGSIASFLTAWSLSSVNRLLVWEIPFFGFKFALLRFFIAILISPLIGFVMRLILKS